ncbi:MAG: DUF4846 domain-containing protein [Cytophaga sp.]|uniref:DUF4846 domain-containing protein n=1 Tax=Cytophaga sp. TaxID=29535 RepID=UPI003F80F20C
MTNVYYIIGTLLCSTLGMFSCGQEASTTLNLHATVPNIVLERFPCPTGYSRNITDTKSFAGWLETLPLKKDGSPVLLFNGELKNNQRIHAAVLNVDRGTRDLQQCADAIMRLRAEYLYQKKAYDSIVFTFTNGNKAAYSKWREGYRPLIHGSTVSWTKSQNRDTTYASFRSYLNTVFMYCGTYSLSKELRSVEIKTIKGGDVFIHGGFPGHAMIVIDVAVDTITGKKIFMLAQSYMPAQDIHIVKNLSDPDLSPWYEIPENRELNTPEWTFDTTDLKRF